MIVLMSIAGYEGDPPGDYRKWVLFKKVDVPWTYIHEGAHVTFDEDSGWGESVKRAYFGMNGMQIEFEVFNIDYEHIWGKQGAYEMAKEHGFSEDGYK